MANSDDRPFEELREIAADMGLEDAVDDLSEEELFKRLDSLFEAQHSTEYDSFEDLKHFPKDRL